MTEPLAEPLDFEWMHDPFITQVVGLLGADSCAFVGGAVRDSLLGHTVADIDLATVHKPHEAMQILENGGVKIVPTGLKHGTITAVGQPYCLEVTTLRSDTETDGRHATVDFIDDWQEDAERRDFTINAIYLRPDGKLLDPVDGVGDLKKQRVRFIGDPGKRIEEDALRILRFYRFSARFSSNLDREGHQACTEKAQSLGLLSAERIRTEFLKFLQYDGAAMVVSKMADAGALQRIFPAGFSLNQINARWSTQLPRTQTVSVLAKLWLITLGFYDARQLSKWLRLSRNQQTYLERLSRFNAGAKVLSGCSEDEGGRYIRKLVYMAGKEVAADLMLLHAPDEMLASYTETTDSWIPQHFPLTGKDLEVIGIGAGPEMGVILRQSEKEWIESDFSLSSNELIERIQVNRR